MMIPLRDIESLMYQIAVLRWRLVRERNGPLASKDPYVGEDGITMRLVDEYRLVLVSILCLQNTHEQIISELKRSRDSAAFWLSEAMQSEQAA